jgi:type III pantothenate kinase
VVKELWNLVARREDAAIAGSSVNPNQLEAIEHIVLEATGKPVQWIGRDIDLPIDVLTDKPSQTGVDRVLNIAAAYEQMGKACVVVDAGTAITIDCCNDKGQFIGGAIAPGVSMMLDALHGRTAKLPRVQFKAPQDAYGRNTEQAILHGVFHGIRGMVKELTENYATALGFWPDIIATGGDAKSLFEGWELIHAVSPELTLYGIALAYTNHHLKHDT